MSYINNDIIERKGVNAVENAFLKIGWIFRETPNTDFGIDGNVEQVIDGKLTGRHIALQIKSGNSYIKVKKNGKITFTIDHWHYSYWLQSDRPVLILLYDPETNNIYWEQVRLANIEKATRYKKIEIQTSKVIDENCLDELNDIISTYVKHEMYHIDEDLISYEFSKACMEEYTASIKDFTEQYNWFKDKIEKQCLNPQMSILHLQIDVFGIEIKKHIEKDYALLHKSCWYLAYLAYMLNNETRSLLLNVLDKNIDNLLLDKTTLLTTINNFKKLFHPNIPKKAQRSSTKVIRYMEDYIALIDLSIEDYLACKIISERIYNEKNNQK